MLEGKKVLLGVCGSIASYKAAYLIRLLIKAGADVQVVMTKDATNFITPLTLSTLSKKPVLVDYFKPDTGEWNQHVALGLWAELLLIAPASANSISKMANGLCDNLLCAIYLSAKCAVYFAPAMDLDMWKHPATQSSVEKLKSFGNFFIAPAYGELASGLVGEGRMSEPAEIVAILSKDLQKSFPLADQRVLVTAGPTYEAIDPVRFIGNHSSGKMGFALADELARLGASVTLVSGPTNQHTQHANIAKIAVTTAAEMLKECIKHFDQSDICVMSAAVADYTPTHVAQQKIKKDDDIVRIDLKKTTDILNHLGTIKRDTQLLVGFALETDDEEANAVAKLKKKNLDFIVLNSLKDNGAGFKSTTNKITIIDRNGLITRYGLKTKEDVAKDICAKLMELINE
ncbi:MAG: bifunctional phosphopantothenoylcysteine decarboxylase/phosphopantothenate--cysteine ligase CoaBC [Sphingobacteriaceae bacterium]